MRAMEVLFHGELPHHKYPTPHSGGEGEIISVGDTGVDRFSLLVRAF